MDAFQISAILLSLAAVFGYLNHRFLKLPTTIGIMLISLVFSIVLLVLGLLSPEVPDYAKRIIESVDFDETLMKIMLGYLLFAGALHVNLNDLFKQKRIIGILATIGVTLSTFLIGTAVYYLLPLFGFQPEYLHCLIFGALISPTDPVAVLGILKTVGAPKTLETKICGESLFNDGIGVVVFVMLLKLAQGTAELSVGSVMELLVHEAVGGVVLGLVLGYVGYLMLKTINNYQVEVLISLAIVTGGYALASALHTSGPLAMVVAGLMIGNQGRSLAMSDVTRDHLDKFWELIDEVLNALLFVLIGLVLVVVGPDAKLFLIGAISIFVVLAARFIAVGIPVTILKRFREFSPRVIRILTWGGLRGGISIALALIVFKEPKIPEETGHIFLVMTYVIVIFSIAVQGLTLKHLIKPSHRG